MTNTYFSLKHYDAIIVGARCAGAATALQLAQMGARVLLIDRDLPSNDTLSTHALMRPAISLMHDWGVLGDVINSGAPMITTTNFYYGTEKIPVSIKPDGEIKGLYAPRRGILDQILVDKAVEFGAEFHVGTTFDTAIMDTNGHVRGAVLRTPDGTMESVSSTVLIGADGRQSSVATNVGANLQAEGPERCAVLYGYFDGIPNDGYRWFFGDQNFSGAIPTNDGAHCVFAATRPDVFNATFSADPIGGMTGVIAQSDPELAETLLSNPQRGRLRRFGGAAGHMRECAGPGWALVGDAGYFKDPSTAHGITDAFLDAHRLAHALAYSPAYPVSYQQERNEISRPLFEITRKIAALDLSPEQLKEQHMKLHQCMKLEQATLQGAKRVSIAAE
ncbi:NAD(P)/FAD-dependent oxidoreductase [Aliiroseovarius sp. KMU-50]|uniref:NAD(P)/FAD-dependent oxidoreductase n=1 Tax=Aliiroseovarius salicola TaxID=3009082 RepID=A0ABT4W5M7_9RHOB|nr:NAD(P)/FAD-dependent oxidoreductase [Aliiroseovarius sp. KMU-50]MDA5095821.1 NAD(P)/FAD-dependent oxidoreductase [Aliiroseovarius sp. KMU-50]